MEAIEVMKKQVEMVEIASYIATKNNFYKSICSFPYLLAFFRSNTCIRFRFANTSKPPLTILPLSLMSTTWISFLSKYPKLGGLRIHLPMIVCIAVELAYRGPSNTFILSENLSSVLQDLTIIKKKL